MYTLRQVLNEINQIIDILPPDRVLDVQEPTLELVILRDEYQSVRELSHFLSRRENRIPGVVAAFCDDGTQYFYAVIVSCVDPPTGWNGYEVVAEVNKRIDDAPVIKHVRIMRDGAPYESVEKDKTQIIRQKRLTRIYLSQFK